MFSERKLTEERKQTVLYQKTEQPVETSCKHKLTANGGTNGLGSLSLKRHSEEKNPSLTWSAFEGGWEII